MKAQWVNLKKEWKKEIRKKTIKIARKKFNLLVRNIQTDAFNLEALFILGWT